MLMEDCKSYQTKIFSMDWLATTSMTIDFFERPAGLTGLSSME